MPSKLCRNRSTSDFFSDLLITCYVYYKRITLLVWRYGVLWFLENMMVQCLDGVKHLLSAVVNCCDSEIYKQPRGLENPEALARETVCMSSYQLNLLSFFTKCKSSVAAVFVHIYVPSFLWNRLVVNLVKQMLEILSLFLDIIYKFTWSTTNNWCLFHCLFDLIDKII